MRTIASLMVVAAVILAADGAFAQRGAGSKISGSAYEYPYFYNSAGAYQQGAYQHADVLREASSYGQPVPREIANEHTAAIRQNIQDANKKYAALRKMAGDHKAVNEQLDTIDAHHKDVMALCDQIDQHCAKGTGDAAAVSDASHEIATRLKSAQAEHEKMMQHFSPPQPKSP